MRSSSKFLLLLSISLILNGCVIGGRPNGEIFGDDSELELDGGGGGSTALTATLTQAASQASTTSTLPITFDINFSESVTGFNASDITFAGDYSSGVTFNITGSGSSYQLVVTGVDHSRKLIPTIQASAAVTADGSSNASTTIDSSQTVAYRPLKFKQVALGASYACGLTLEGVAYCWGDDTNGYLGNGAALTAAQSTPSLVDTSTIAGEKTFKQISAWGYHVCALTHQGVPYCWGDDASSQLGNGAGLTAAQASPSAVDTSTVTGEKAFVQISTGQSHSCGITAEGVAYCWGDDTNGKLGNGAGLTTAQESPSPVDVSGIAGSTKFVQISTGVGHTCGITSDGIAYCWGDDTNGKLGNGAGLTTAQESPSQVDTSTIAGEKAFAQVSAGSIQSCGITSEGVGYCWGADTSGRLGNGAATTTAQASPSAVDTTVITGAKNFVQITSGVSHVCGLLSDGAAYCWGADFGNGLLGNGPGITGNQVSPSPVDTSTITGEKAIIQLATNSTLNGCALTAQGNIYCWGSDSSSQLGNGAALTADQVSPSAVDTSGVTSELAFVQLTSGGYSHACGLTVEGVAYCWGVDTSGQLGNGSTITADQHSPSEVDTSTLTGEKTFTQLIAGGYHTCGLTAEGDAYCWGLDSSGQLGNGAGATTAQESPSLVDTSGIAGVKVFVHLTAGMGHTCGITIEGAAYCWGADGNGQLGNAGTTGNQVSPSAVDTSPISGEVAFKQLAAGQQHTCGLTSEGVAYCWGYDQYGQLGNAGALADPDQTSPVAVDTSPIAGETEFKQLTTGQFHSCGLTSEGVAYCWGSDVFGRLGNGAGTTSTSPSAVDTTAITGEKAFVQLSAGHTHTCGLTSEGVAYCWGENSLGELGDNSNFTNQVSPVPVDTSSITGNQTFARIYGSIHYSCGITGQGAAYCWGYDIDGRLGNGATLTANQEAPSAVDISEL